MSDKPLFIVCGTLGQGGAERIISILSKCFLGSFSEVKIILWRSAPVFYSIDKRIEIVCIPEKTETDKLITHMKWFRKYVMQHTSYAVLSFLAPFNMLSIVSLLGSGIPVFIASRSDPRHDAPNWLWRWIRDCIYGLAAGISVQTEDNKKYFPFFLRRKIQVIYNPVFIKQELISSALKATESKVVVSVGRLSREKNQLLLLDAFEEFHRKFGDYRLIIYGEGNYRAILERRIRELKAEEYIFLPGSDPDVISRITNAQMFVMTSDYEGMSNALIEAMCLGLPCISTRVSGAEEIIEDGVNGKLINIGDKAELVTILTDWAEDENERREIASEGIKIASKLNLNIIVKLWIAFLSRNSSNNIIE